jgi:hypothetical protein
MVQISEIYYVHEIQNLFHVVSRHVVSLGKKTMPVLFIIALECWASKIIMIFYM